MFTPYHVYMYYIYICLYILYTIAASCLKHNEHTVSRKKSTAKKTKELQEWHQRSLITDHYNKYNNNANVWNTVRIRKMWHRDMKRSNTTGKMGQTCLNRLATDLQFVKKKNAGSAKYNKDKHNKKRCECKCKRVTTTDFSDSGTSRLTGPALLTRRTNWGSKKEKQLVQGQVAFKKKSQKQKSSNLFRIKQLSRRNVKHQVSVQCPTQLLLIKANEIKWLPEAQNADIFCLVLQHIKNSNNSKQNTRIR